MNRWLEEKYSQILSLLIEWQGGAKSHDFYNQIATAQATMQNIVKIGDTPERREVVEQAISNARAILNEQKRTRRKFRVDQP